MKPVFTLAALLLVSGCAAPTAFIEGMSDPRQPVDMEAKFWIFQPADESLEERRIRYVVEGEMKSRGLHLTRLADSEYVLSVTFKDDRVVAKPGGLIVRRLWFEITKSSDYGAYLTGKGKEPSAVWKGYIGIDSATFEKNGQGVIRDFIRRLPADFKTPVSIPH